MPQVLLIDDEASARADLREKLASHRGVAIVGEAATLGAARALLLSADYDLVFLDVVLVGGESFRLLPDVRPGASVVFATAHGRYAVRAFESGAIDYLLKPIDSTRLAEALRRAAHADVDRRLRDATAAPMLSARPAPVDAAVDDRHALGGAAIPENFCEVALTDDERVFLRQCLEAWEDALPAAHLLRAPAARLAGLPRAVRYARDAEPTRLFLAPAPASRARRWWRELRTRLGS